MPNDYIDIPGYEGIYAVSKDGKVGRLKGSSILRILKPATTNRGYYRVSLSKNGLSENRTIHYLVALSYIGPKPPGYQINHKNGIKKDNCVENLEYCTASSNARHSFALGLSNQKGEKNNFSKLKPIDVLVIKYLAVKGYGPTVTSEITGINRGTVCVIRRERIWKDVGKKAIQALLKGEK